MSENILVRVPDMLREEADLYVESGFFESRSELIREAMREFLEKLDKEKEGLAVDLYRKGKISLSRAAEISGVGYEKMKEILTARGIPISRGPGDLSELENEYSAAKTRL
jgi:Arc/MetJ-type ribon-helix-helix transcriptional regulator